MKKRFFLPYISALTSVILCFCGTIMSPVTSHAQEIIPENNEKLCDAAIQHDNAPATKSEQVSRIDSAAKCKVGPVHADAFATYVDPSGNLVLATRADELDSHAQNGVRYDPNRLIFILDGHSKTTVSSTLDTQYDFLRAATVNNEFWQIPFTRQPGMLWAGMSSEALAGKADGKVTMSMINMTGPRDGSVYMWTWDGANKVHRKMASPNVIAHSSNIGTTAWPSDYQLDIPQHEHVQWAFTRPGLYVLTMKASARINGEVKTAIQDYTFDVESSLTSSNESSSEAAPQENAQENPQENAMASNDEAVKGVLPRNTTNNAGVGEISDSGKANHTASNVCLTLSDLKHQGHDVMVIDHGHVDIAAYTPVGGGLFMAVQEDITGMHVRRDTDSVVFWVHGAQTRSGGGYSAPQTSVPGVPWVGWNNQSMKPHLPVTMTLLRVQGPGSVRVWLQGDLGQPNQTVVSTSGPFSYTMMRNTHTHANWDFSAPGYYTLTLAYSALSGTVTRDIHFAVGDIDPWKMPITCNAVSAQSVGRSVPAAAVSSHSHARGSLPELGSHLDGDRVSGKSKKHSHKHGNAEGKRKNGEDKSKKTSQRGAKYDAADASTREASLRWGEIVSRGFKQNPILTWLIITLTCVVLSVLGTVCVVIMGQGKKFKNER